MRRFAFLLIATVARADNPNWPTAPDVADLSAPATWPDDPGYGGQWNLFSFVPSSVGDRLRAEERALGSGIAADRAWQRTIGDPRVVIAVLDSGIRWGDDDLVNQIHLNRGELPPPEGCPAGAGPGTDPYDRDGDGAFSVRDYTTAAPGAVPAMSTVCDARLADTNGNGMLDGQDLIRIFSDGVDGDGNGYTDDIAGWDALDGDNDPLDDTDFGHGTGEAADSAAETNNGRGDAGVCPRCRILPVRVGQSFVADSNDFALGVAFAVESGASVVQEALGTIDNSHLGREAIDYAHENNLTIVASAADEDSYHHNMPATNDHMLVVHAVTHDGDDVGPDTTTFLAFNNCTNYGAQLLLSTSGAACSSEATGKTSGLVGLLYSAALAAGLDAPPAADPRTDLYGARRLTGDEVRSLLTSTVDDIDWPDAPPDHYRSGPGWEARFGYGRPHARRAVDAVLDGDLPPSVDVTEPKWFQVIDPTRTPMLEIRGAISARGAPVDYTIEWAPGIEPPDAAFQTICHGTETSLDGDLCAWDIADLVVENPPQPAPDYVANRHLVTLRVRASAGGRAGEVRRAFHVATDPDLLAAFPIDLGGSGESSPKTADLDGDGTREIVVATSDGLVHAFRADGTELAGFPAAITPLPQLATTAPALAGVIPRGSARSAIIATPAIGDLDGDGRLEIVVCDFDRHVHVIEADGTPRPGFPVGNDPAQGPSPSRVVENGFFSSPALADLDHDGHLEIVAGGMDARLYAWTSQGYAQSGFPVTLHDGRAGRTEYIVASPAVGDLDGDGTLEIVVGTTENYRERGRLYVVEAGGQMRSGFPVGLDSHAVLPMVGSGLPSSPALADIDGDGRLEIAVQRIAFWPVLVDASGHVIDPGLDVVHFDAASPIAADQAPMLSLIGNSAFGDLDDDGALDFVAGGAGSRALDLLGTAALRVDVEHLLGAWTVGRAVTNADGTAVHAFLHGFPARIDDWQFFMAPALADVDGDGHPEAVYGSAGYAVHALNGCGVEARGWPKFTGQWMIASPAVGDLDGDGLLEAVVATRSGWLYAWHTAGASDGRIDWEGFQHDLRNTGNFATPLSQGTARARGSLSCEPSSPGDGGPYQPPPPGTSLVPTGGCGCRVAEAPVGAPLVAFGVAFALALSTRRRRIVWAVLAAIATLGASGCGSRRR